ncbi:hypothetical protein D3C87_1696760 [compost metagenome]
MQKKTADQLRAETIAAFEERNEESRAELARIEAGEISNLFVLRQDRGNICIRINEIGQPRNVSPINATRYKWPGDARTVGLNIENGAGENPRVIVVSQALREDIETTEHLIATLRGLMGS